MNSKLFMIYTGSEQVCPEIQFVTRCSPYLLHTLPNKPMQGLTANCQFVIYISSFKSYPNLLPTGPRKMQESLSNLKGT